MKTSILKTSLIALSLLVATDSLHAQKEAGDFAGNFTIANRLETGDLSLFDYAGHVIVLDFFAYWCGPCQTSSPDLEVNVAQYYAGRGGNAHGVPVTVIAVNIESGDEYQTDMFVSNAGLSLVANDYQREAWNTYTMGYIPHFVVINGVNNSPSYEQWEIIHTNYGYPGATYFRNLIDTVEPGITPPVDFNGWLNSDTYPYLYSSSQGWLYLKPTDEGLWVCQLKTNTWKLMQSN